jgi:hypothetical protein
MLRGVKGNCTKLQRWNGTSYDEVRGRISMTGPGLTRETVEEELVIDCDASGGNPFKKKSPGTKEIGDISLEILWNPIYPDGTHQVETATGAGTVSGAGNASVTITAAALTGSPLVLAIPVPTGAPAVWMTAIRTWLLTSSNAGAVAVRDVFDLPDTAAAPTTLILKRKVPAANDATMNIALATGTATGITTAATSAHTTAGVDGTENDENHHLFEDDFENETATFWRVVHPNDAVTGVIVHATVKEVGEPSYEANTNVKRTVVLEPTGEFYRSGNEINEVVLPASITAPVDHYGHH